MQAMKRKPDAIVRLAEWPDFLALVDLAEAATALHPHLKFSKKRALNTFSRYMNEANPTIWVAESRGAIVGALAGDIGTYLVADGHFTVVELFYVQPEKRGTRAASLLIREFVEWSDNLKASEIAIATDTGQRSAQFARFIRRFGFAPAGTSMRRRA